MYTHKPFIRDDGHTVYGVYKDGEYAGVVGGDDNSVYVPAHIRVPKDL